MQKRLRFFIIAAVALAVMAAAYLSETRRAVETGFALDTVISVTAKGNKAKTATASAVSRVYEIERRLTSYSQTSEIVTGVLGEDASAVIRRGIFFGDKSDGLFDITVKPLTDLWGISTPSPRVPSREEIERVLPLIDYKKVEIKENRLILPKDMAIDLGGIGKGYAADEAARVLRQYGIKDGIVDLGGNIVVIGEKRIGIQNPKSNRTGDYMGIIKARDCAIVTSGNYERNFVQDGRTYHHIFNPKTGMPSDSGLLSATVVCENSQDADAIATIIFIMGAEDGLSFARSMGVQALTVSEDGEVRKTEGIEIEITDSSFFFRED
ncbi:MAG: Thiamine biosynthesis lipoprotein ApbE precursor [Firmicutes bacterium ADurb.Bin193]|nr:MAG: Thiamine biosynthesis lipoprotein ApbE precursor [Firmicutes bacterium ADurb.Bin193]